jgi:quinoprotein glucose dehydrogenase
MVHRASLSLGIERMNRSLHLTTAAGVALIGLFLALLGARLATLGGSPFYMFFGVGWLVTAALLLQRTTGALALFAAILIATMGWALWDCGFQFWGLEVRLAVPTALGLWMLLAIRQPGRLPLVLAVAALLLLLSASFLSRGRFEIHNATQRTALPLPAKESGQDWPQYGGGPHADRYSSLAQLTPDNVSRLEVAWVTHTGDHKQKMTFESPALKVGDTLYICSGSAWIFALDPVTGRIKWRFVPPKPSVRITACRGVTYAVLADVPEGTPCGTRIFAPAPNARIVALDAQTGALCDSFGEHGYIDLKNGLGPNALPLVGISSPPLFLKGRLVTGLYVQDNIHDREPSGVVRAFDARTGTLAWSWDIGRTPSNKPLAPGEVYTPGTPNVWGVITGDATLGLVFLPTGNPTPDYFGGQRRAFDERYNSSLVALDIETGLERWRFQTVHHDLWDMDVPTGPTLLDFGGRPALLQTTKRGEVFILDRATGKPLSQVVERPTSRGDIKEDHYAPTQPWNVGMQSLSAPPIRESDTWGATLLDQLMCRIEYRSLRYDGPFTPPSLQGSLVYPAFFGLTDWGGASVDPGRNLAFFNLSYLPWVVQLVPRDEALRRKIVKAWDGTGPSPPDPKQGISPQYKTPYVALLRAWLNPIGVPCLRPPLGEMAAMDLRTRKIAWKHTYGTARHSGPFGLDNPLPLPTGIYTVGGPISTAGGLVFVAGGLDRALRALDSSTGDELWSADLPAPGAATASTYLGRDGRQYVVIAGGGHWSMGKAASDQLIAYALPKNPAAEN